MTVTTYPTAPTVVPLRGTLLDAATVESLSGYRMVHDTDDLFESYNCMRFDAETGAWCEAQDPPKEFSSASWVTGFRFGVYGGVECKTIGLDRDDMQAKARKVFESGESTGIERALMRARFAEGPDDPDDPGTPLWEAPTDITPAGGAVSATLAVALLEGFMADTYSGVSTFHLPRTVAALLVGPQTVQFEGDRLTTKLGSKIAAGAGYDFPNLGPDGEPADTGERWVYGTGEVYLNRGDLIVRDAIDFSTNDARVLVERPYMAALDCAAVVAIRVNLTA